LIRCFASVASFALVKGLMAPFWKAARGTQSIWCLWRTLKPNSAPCPISFIRKNSSGQMFGSPFGGSPRIYSGEERFSAPETPRHQRMRFSAGHSGVSPSASQLGQLGCPTYSVIFCHSTPLNNPPNWLSTASSREPPPSQSKRKSFIHRDKKLHERIARAKRGHHLPFRFRSHQYGNLGPTCSRIWTCADLLFFIVGD
jgi:hypothetical protein